jgi:endonuclease/exonuclease/phosphatase family metal-dependent hydrolase
MHKWVSPVFLQLVSRPVLTAVSPGYQGTRLDDLVEQALEAFSRELAVDEDAVCDWRRDLNRLPVTMSDVGEQAGAGSVIVAADLNSTTDMRPFRALLRNGYRDAAEQSGAGIKPTFPADSRLPPFVAIDHILARNCTATSLRTLKIQGSDHRGLVVTIAIPRSSARPQSQPSSRRTAWHRSRASS